MVALFALALAMPVALGIAIFLAQYSPRRVTGPLAYVGRPARSGPVDHLRGLGPLRACPAAAIGGHVAQRASGRGVPVRDRQRDGGRRRDHLHRRDRAGGDDPADHHRGHPRGLHEDARRATSRPRWRSAPPAGRWSRPRCCHSGGPDTSAARYWAWAARWERPSHCWSSCAGPRQPSIGRCSTVAIPSPRKSRQPHTNSTNQYRAGAYIAAGLMLFLLTLLVNAIARQSVSGKASR